MAWRACHEKLLKDGYINIDSPKATMRQAYAAGLIDDEAAWLSLLQVRGLSSHMYNKEQVEQIFAQVLQTYLALFERIINKLK